MEEVVSLNKLVSTILIFTIALLVVGSARMYVNANTIFGRLEIRTNLTFKIHEKLSVTSYPNIGEQKFLEMLDRAGAAVSGNEGAIASIWDTFTELMQCIIGLIIYLFLFSTMNFLVVFITVVTTIIGYFVNKYINGWGYRHREEEAEYSHKLQYISNLL